MSKTQKTINYLKKIKGTLYDGNDKKGTDMQIQRMERKLKSHINKSKKV